MIFYDLVTYAVELFIIYKIILYREFKLKKELDIYLDKANEEYKKRIFNSVDMIQEYFDKEVKITNKINKEIIVKLQEDVNLVLLHLFKK